MKMVDKRRVIEVLMCGTDYFGPSIEMMSATFGDVVCAAADRLWIESAKAAADTDTTYEDDSCEAAYRLIETSAALKREWFGKAVRS